MILQNTDKATAPETAIPLRLVAESDLAEATSRLNKRQHGWMLTTNFTAKTGEVMIVSDDAGSVAEVWLGIGRRCADTGMPVPILLSRRSPNQCKSTNGAITGNTAQGDNEAISLDAKALLPDVFGPLAKKLPKGCYRIAGLNNNLAKIAAIAMHRAQLTPIQAGEFTGDVSALSSSLSPKVSVDLPPDHLAYVDAVDEADALVRNLVNLPANLLGTKELAEAAQCVANKYRMQCIVVSGAELERNYPMLSAVGLGSSQLPQLIELTCSGYNDASTNALPKVCVIGKGIVFDTGGLDLKPSSNMRLMKKDMGGAAHALGLATLIRKLELPIALRVLIPAAENSVSSRSYRPGDVLTARDGTTVEVGNTDAEGRLALADALIEAVHPDPDALITLATLTGAARVAVGTDMPAIMSDNRSWSAQLEASAREVCDPVWSLPLFAGYDSGLASQVADICSISKSPFAGATCAGLFLRRFIANPHRWLHFDLYSWGTTPGCVGESAKMQGMEALVHWLRHQFPA